MSLQNFFSIKHGIGIIIQSFSSKSDPIAVYAAYGGWRHRSNTAVVR